MFYRRLIKRILPVVYALRRREHQLAFLVCASFVNEVSGVQASSDKDQFVKMKKTGAATSINMPISDGLLLYYDRFSFYSQKVVMALHEKNLPFDSKIVNLVNSEQYSSWFLNLNPRGEVPVLQDNGKIIPDSARIIDYLEDNFSNGDTPRLIPMDLGPPIRQKVTHYRHRIQQAQAGALTTGAVLNQQLLKNPKTPFYGPVRNALAKAEKNAGQKLREIAEKNPEAKEILLKKAAAREQKYNLLCDEKNFEEILDEITGILNEIELELSANWLDLDKTDWWLCCNKFTVADVELTILLIRISQLGLDYKFWGSGLRPSIEKYYEKVKLRDSYKKTVPGTLVLIQTILMAQAPIIIGVVAAVALIVGGAICVKKYA